MGEVIAKIKVTSLAQNGWVEFDAVVDTGATYTSLPKRALEDIGIFPFENIVIRLADGRKIKRNLANCIVKLEGNEAANVVLMAEEEDAIVIGLVTLESCRLTVDPISQKLVLLPEIHHYFKIKNG